MDIRELIMNILNKRNEVKVADIVELTGFSRVYVHRFFQELRHEGKIMLVGKANRSRYVLPHVFKKLKLSDKGVYEFNAFLSNRNLQEDIVLEQIKKNTAIFCNLNLNVTRILEYTFTEMLNNAIEHSKSKFIRVKVKRDKDLIRFDVIDSGIGIFNNILHTRELKTHMEAIQDLIKGKQTTAQEAHSGEGIFFTSKIADMLVIKSFSKKLIFNNIIDDIFVENIKSFKGTGVIFSIKIDSKKRLDTVFKKYTDDSFEFSKTEVLVRLYKMGSEYISRSQARRVLSGLDRFKTIMLDFKDVDTIGQGFADEVFRVWAVRYPDKKINYCNANENIEFMIKRALP